MSNYGILVRAAMNVITLHGVNYYDTCGTDLATSTTD